jgi:hypothetical protein
MNKDAGRGNFLFVTLRLEDGEELPFILDTGSPATLFDKSLAPKLKRLPLGTWKVPMPGDIQKSGIYLTPKLYLGTSRLKTGSLAATIDFKRLSAAAGRPVMGLLAMDCLRHYCIQLDFDAGKIRFLDPDKVDATKLGKVFPLKLSPYNSLFIRHASLAGGKNSVCLIDTGWDSDGEVEKDKNNGNDSGLTHLPECTWDGETYSNVFVWASGDANRLGLDFLARHLVTLNFPKHTMYLKQTSIGPLGDEGMYAAMLFLKDLKQNGQAHAWSKNDKGMIALEAHAGPGTFAFKAWKPGDPSIYHYEVVRASVESPWKLRKEWRTDQNGKTLEEYAVP